MYVLSFMYSVIADAGRLSEYAQLERTISSSSLTSGYAPLTLTVKKKRGRGWNVIIMTINLLQEKLTLEIILSPYSEYGHFRLHRL